MNIKSSQLVLVILSLLLLSGTHAFAQNAAAPVTSASAPESETEIQDSGKEENSEAVVKEVSVSDDELPSESVTPVTDNSSSVLNKKVRFTKRFQLDLNTGSVLDEAIVNSSYFLVRASYYTNEEYSFGVGIKTRFGGRTTYSDQLYQGSAQLNFDRAPAPTSGHFVSFGYNFFYGKISLGKSVVIPASTKLETDFGLQSWGSTSKPFLQSAVNQSFFMNKHLSVGFSIGLSLAQISDPTSVNVRSTQPVPSESSFSNKIQFNQFLSVNLNALL